MTAASEDARTLSVVVPVYDEVEVLRAFHARLGDSLARLELAWEVIYVDDGSGDGTRDIVADLCERDHRVGSILLSRHFGKELAITAGIDHAAGDAVVIIDADLQDPPELIPEMVRLWSEQGVDNVYAERASRFGETALKKSSSDLFYRLMPRVGDVRLPANTGDFRLLSRRAVAALRGLREQHRFMKGLFAWIGYSQQAVTYHREPRAAGRTKWGYWRLLNLAIDGLTSFSVMPLRVAGFVGLGVAVAAFVYGIVVVYKSLVYGDSLAGYPSLMVALLFLGGVQLVALGIIGEYLGRVFNETKGRPLYLVESYRPATAARSSPDSSPREPCAGRE